MTITPSRPRSRRGEGDRLRGEILDAAEALLIETGSEDAVSVRAVAERVGVTAPAIYKHFADKHSLLFEVCDLQFRRLEAFLDTKRIDHDDPVEAVRACGRAYIEFGLAHPEHYRIMFMGRSDLTPEQYQDEVLAEQGSFMALVSAVQDCVEANDDQRDAFDVAVLLWIAVHGLTSLMISKPSFPWPREDMVEFTLDSLAASLLAGPA